MAMIGPFLKELYETWTTQQPARLAAALAYYGMFSFAPMLFFAITAAGIFFSELAIADQLFDRLADTLGPETAHFLQDMVINASERISGSTTLTTLISIGALLYAATGLFAQLKYSLNVIWDVSPPPGAGIMNFIKTRLLAFVMVLGVGLIFVLAAFLSFVGSALTSLFDFGFEVMISNVVSFIALSALSFALVYKILPDVKVAWGDVWLGAGVTAILFAAGRWGLGFYLSHSNVSSAFEAAGALAIVLITIYYAAQIFLLGAIFTRVYATRFGSRTNY
jgi:membrane protein